MTEPRARIIYNQYRKPFLADGSYNISISHSYKATAILISREHLVGVDLEYMSHKIERLAHKFINYREVISDDPELRRIHLYVHWCAKEALYKICDKEDINFQTNLTIRPFVPRTDKFGGDITGVVRNNLRDEEYRMHYMVDNNYVLVYCIK
jgi:hypothetical protein